MTLFMFTSMMIFYLLDTMTSSHPLILSIKVLMLALSLCLTMSFFTTWYAYMIFMVMLGGVLVMFIYISSIAPNSIFKMKSSILYLSIQMSIMFLLSYDFILSHPKALVTQKPFAIPENLVTFYLSSSHSSLLLMMASALLLSMLIVTNLLSNSKNAMRSTNMLMSSTM
uniref:NADH dehydrogenase subunit 6 n=1 Tax=Unio pictorum TaxID=55837 RepID=A0A346HGU9_UNIPI|nr:NADH dehydrogenase subunit 6 [Unio pictorum]AXO78635.1 NADH dehydrogenase subunit 6 [Unio pictorum]